MCLNPISIRNKSKYVDYKNGGYMFYTVPCGHCSECVQDKIDSYMIRAKAETDYVLSRGGLAYVECLTYDELHVPRHPKYDQLRIFSKRDIQLFLKRLKNNLERAGYCINEPIIRYDDNGIPYDCFKKIVPLKYFISSEYGGQFHRPHYHCLFWFDMPISPEEFEKFISDAWNKGILDFYKKDGSRKSSQDKVIHGIGAMQYVAKYCIKDDDFYFYLESLLNDVDSLDHKMNLLDKFKSMNDLESYKKQLSEIFDNSLQEDKRALLMKDIQPFHLQSNGLGISLSIKYEILNGESKHTRDYKFMYETGMYSFTDETNVERHIKIPQYIKRKLWYESYKDFDGRWHWVLNNDGINQKLDHLNKSIELLSERYQSILQNINNYCDDNRKASSIIDNINCYLGNRNFHDFATYLIIYKGRLFEDHSDLPDMYDLYCHVNSLSPESSSGICIDREDYSDDLPKRVFNCNCSMSFEEFLDRLSKKFMVNENSFYIFNDFDKLYSIFVELQQYKNKEIESRNFVKRCLKSQNKLLDSRYSQHELNNIKHREHLKSHIYGI